MELASRKRSWLLLMAIATSVAPAATVIANWSASKPKLLTKAGARAAGDEIELLNGLSTGLTGLARATPLADAVSGRSP
jgi:hypothetical protein